MATGAVIGALRVVLGADTAALTKGLGSAQSDLEGFASFAKKTLATLGISATVAGITESLKSTIDAADSLGKVAQKIGIPVDQLSQLQFAAKLSNVSLDDLTTSLFHLDKQISATAGGQVTTFSKALDAMNISIKDANGNVKSQSDLLGEIATKFASYQDGVAKTALATELFGRAGANLIPFLNQGASGIARLKEEAAALGITLDASTAKAASDFNDNLTRLSTSSAALQQRLVAELLPGLIQLTNTFINFKSSTAGSDDILKSIGQAFNTVAGEIAGFIVEIGGLGKQWEALRTAMQVPIFGPDFIPAWQRFFAVTNETERQAAIVRSSFQSTGQATQQFAMDMGTLATAAGTVAAPLLQAAAASKNALDSFLDSQQKAAQARAIEAQTIGMEGGARAGLLVQLQAELVAKQNNIPITAAYRAEIDKTAASAAAAGVALQGATVKQDTLSANDKYIQQLNNINTLLQKGAISADTAARLQRKAAVDAGAAWDIAGASIAGSLATISGTFAKSSSGIATAAKAFAIVQATLSVYTGMAKALELPFPANIAAAAAVAAQGFTFIANIKSQTVPKFATGGSFMVPGGSSFSDDKLISMALAAGEKVDVTPANQAGGDIVNIDMRGDQPFYSRAVVERLANALHTVTLDGHNVQVVVLK